MKIGIVGAGFMGRTHATAWRSCGCEIAGVADRYSAQYLADEFGGKIFDSVEELSAAVDLVDICSPTYLHYDHILSAITGSPRAIFCEKPLARSLKDAEEAVAACRQASIPLGVGHVLRYFPEYRRAQACVEQGELGSLGVLRFSRGTFVPRKNWFHNRDKSGGVILDLMIHDIDFSRVLAGEVTRVFARIDAPPSETKGGIPMESAYIFLNHRNGAISHIEGSWHYPQPEFHSSFEIAGSRALLCCNSDRSNPLSLHLTHNPKREPAGETAENSKAESAVPAVAPAANLVPVAASPLADDPYALELQAFKEAVLRGEDPPVNGEDGTQTLRIALAALDSAVSGLPVTINAGTGKHHNSHRNTEGGAHHER